MHELLEWINSAPAESVYLVVIGAVLAAGLAIQIINSVLNCFLGYFMYRFWMVLIGAGLFALLPVSGRFWFDWRWGVILSLSLAMLPIGGFVFFRFYRVITAALWAFNAGGLFVVLTSFGLPPAGRPLSSLPLGVNVFVGVLLAAGVAVMVYVFVRHVIIWTTALQGGAALLMLSWTLPVVVLAVTCTVFGIILQYRLTARFYRDEPEKAKPEALAKRPPVCKRRAA